MPTLLLIRLIPPFRSNCDLISISLIYSHSLDAESLIKINSPTLIHKITKHTNLIVQQIQNLEQFHLVNINTNRSNSFILAFHPPQSQLFQMLITDFSEGFHHCSHSYWPHFLPELDCLNMLSISHCSFKSIL